MTTLDQSQPQAQTAIVMLQRYYVTHIHCQARLSCIPRCVVASWL